MIYPYPTPSPAFYHTIKDVLPLKTEDEFCLALPLHYLEKQTSQPLIGINSFQKKPFRCMLPSASPRSRQSIAMYAKFPSCTALGRMTDVECRKNNVQSWRLGPKQSMCLRKPVSIPEWHYHVHPSGQPYYECTRSDSRFRYLTEADVTKTSILEEIFYFTVEFEQEADSYPEISSDVEVVIDINGDAWQYYMADLNHRRIFWIHGYEMTLTDFGIERLEQLRHKFDAEFWRHIGFFPCHRPLLPGVLEELLGILAHSHIDVLTSNTSHVRQEGSKIQSHLDSVSRMLEMDEDSTTNGYIASASARLMEEIANDRFENFYGFHGARLSANQSVRGQTQAARTWLISLLSPILLSAPEGHLTAIRDLWIDFSIRTRRWKHMITNLEKDWEKHVLCSTVLLVANIAFLVTLSFAPGHRYITMSIARQLSQLSIIASLGSIVTGFTLINRTRNGCEDKTSDTIAYLRSKKNAQLGLETLAIQLSLPYAMLLWCSIAFLAAVLFMCIGLQSWFS